MKKLLFAALLLLNLAAVNAVGPDDGIYAARFNGALTFYVSLHETDNQVVVVIVSPDPNNTWEPMSGTRSGNVLSLTHISGVSPSDIQLTATVNLNINGASTATINSCVDGVSYICQFPPGITFNLDKVF